MRLAQLELVNRANLKRRQLLRTIEDLAAGKLRVSIDGDPQDDAMIALVRIPVERELRARVASLESDMTSMGVQIDREQTAIFHHQV